MKIGFLIVDMQNIFLQDRMERLNVEAACEYINHVAGLLRAKDQVVVHVHDMEGSDEDTDVEARNTIPEIAVGANDIRIEKQYSNAFWQTDLEQVLRDQEVGLVIVAGFAAEQCVTFTLNGAMERGFQSVLLQGGIVSTYADAISSIYRDRPVTSYKMIEFMMSNIK